MTGSRVRKFLRAAAMSALFIPAAAQWSSDKPPVLGPDDYPPEATQDPPDSPAQPDKNAPPASDNAATGAPQSLGGQMPPESTPLPPIGAAVPPPVPVEVGSLGTPEGPPAGTLDSSNGGVGEHLWSGTDRARAEELLAKSPVVSADPVLRDLARRVLLTKAGAPPGSAPKAFATVRIERLLDAGLIQEAGALAVQVSIPNDDVFARVQANAILLANRAQDACGPATSSRLSAGDVFWMQLRAYCAAVGGDTAAAELTRQVLKVQGHGDPAYDALVEGILSKKPLPAGAIAQPTAIHIFLLQQAGLPVTEAVARKMGTPENLLVARDTRNPPRARFEAAERIVSTGALNAAELKQIADAQDLPLNRVANAAADAPNLPFFMGQVILRRAATIEPRPEEKARLVETALSLGDKFKMAPLAAALQSDVIATLKPATISHIYARTFVRALILSGRADVAARWTGGDTVMRAVVALASRDPARMAAAQADLSAFAASIVKDPLDPDPDRSTKALVLGLTDVLDATMPADAKAVAVSVESQMWGGSRPGPGQMRTIEELAQSPDRRGEALLLILNAVHSIGLRDMEPNATMEFVRLLNGMNETASARALALEALAQYQPIPVLPSPLPPPAAAQ